MISRNVKLVIDMGNSQTRVKTIVGKNPDGTSKGILSIMDNRYGNVPEEKVSLFLTDANYKNNYTMDNSSLFVMDNGMYYCNGELCNMEMSQFSIRPSATEKKYRAVITKPTIMNALKQGYMDASKLLDVPLKDLYIDWDVTLLLPPEDVDTGAKLLGELVRSITRIKFFIPSLEKKISYFRVTVLPEGMCAFFGVLYERKGCIRAEYKYLLSESTIIIDIGAGTTDIVLVKNGKVMQSSRFTRAVGGNNVHRTVMGSLRRNEKIALPDEVIREGVITGYVKSGSRKIDISKYISEAKKAVSAQLRDAVLEFFEASMISIETISNILVCGGGAEFSSNPELHPLSEYILSFMKELSPDIKLVETPMVIGKTGWERMSPRLMNITGACVLVE